MIKIVRVNSARLFCEFVRFGGKITPDAFDPARERHALRPWYNPVLRRGRHAFYLAQEEGITLARIMTGNAGTRQGYFSMFECAPRFDAAREILSAAVMFQKACGASSMVGPVSPDLIDFPKGIRLGTQSSASVLNAKSPSYYGDYFTRCGFRVFSDHDSFGFSADDPHFSRYEQLSAWAQHRFALTEGPVSVKSTRALAVILWEIMNPDAKISIAHTACMLKTLSQYLCDDFLRVVFHKGRPVGFLMGLYQAGAPLRAATIWVTPDMRNGAVTACLIAGFLGAARAHGIKDLEASTIEKAHLSSYLCAQNAGGTLIHTYRQYLSEF